METTQVHKLIENVFPELDTIIGWTETYDPLRTTPVFIRDAKSIPTITWSPFCSHNLTGYLVKPPALQPEDKTKKIGICVKGCDSRSLVALIQEKLLSREKLFIFGFACRGTVDWRKVVRLLNSQSVLGPVISARVENDRLVVEAGKGSQTFKLEDVLARKCLRCRYPNPIIQDVMIGEAAVPRATRHDGYRDVDAVEKLSLEERMAFWQSELDRCMRCYACRNACPLCVCQDRCIAETRDPKWLTQHMGIREKSLFHLIHAMHLAGRCTGCGECERVCPVEIPVSLIKEKLNEIVEEMLGYEAGIDPAGIPPLLTFNPGETGI